jgi:hypothetical protein
VVISLATRKKESKMNNKEAAVYFRNEMLAGNGMKDVDLSKFHQILGISSDDPKVPEKPKIDSTKLPVLKISGRVFEIFDGKQWNEINPLEMEPGQKVVRITVRDGK